MTHVRAIALAALLWLAFAHGADAQCKPGTIQVGEQDQPVGNDIIVHPLCAKPRDAMRQLLTAAASVPSADCIFEGRATCAKPVALSQVTVGGSPQAVPVEVLAYIASIPASIRARPQVQLYVRNYEYFASLRATAENAFINDVSAEKANPNDPQLKLNAMGHVGPYNAAVDDERQARERLAGAVDSQTGGRLHALTGPR